MLLAGPIEALLSRLRSFHNNIFTTTISKNNPASNVRKNKQRKFLNKFLLSCVSKISLKMLNIPAETPKIVSNVFLRQITFENLLLESLPKVMLWDVPSEIPYRILDKILIWLMEESFDKLNLLVDLLWTIIKNEFGPKSVKRNPEEN